MLRKLKKILLILIIGIVIVTLSMIFFRKTISFDMGKQASIEAKFPIFHTFMLFSSESRCLLRYKSEQGVVNFASLLHNAFDRPILLFFDKEKKKVYCLYDFDVRVELIVFEVNSTGASISSALEKIVPVSEWKVKEGEPGEIDYLKEYVAVLNLEQIKQYSVPTIDIGPFKHYLTKEQLQSVMSRLPYPQKQT